MKTKPYESHGATLGVAIILTILCAAFAVAAESGGAGGNGKAAAPASTASRAMAGALQASEIRRTVGGTTTREQDVPKPYGLSLGLPRPGKGIRMPPDRNIMNGGSVVTLVRGDPNLKEIALTFDDGPHPPFTQRLLDLLKQLNVQVTFFLVGKKVVLAPDVVARMVREGHDVANHTYDHIDLLGLPLNRMKHEIRMDNIAIRNACGQEPVFFRPPGGHHEPSVIHAAEDARMTTVLWTDDPADYAKPAAGVLEARLLRHIRPGAVVLLHDGVEQTLEMLPDLVARLKLEGYKFVTVSEMAHRLESVPGVHG